MKKILFLCLSMCCFLFAGCASHNLGENESIYKGELIISGVGPEISMEPTIENGTLVLGGSFEDHTDHIFLSKGIWEKYFNDESGYLPGNTVKFNGVVEFLDGAAGNHYYNVKIIDKLELIKYPNAGEIKEIFDGYNYCEIDDDCVYFVGECPLGCYITMNKKFVGISQNIVSNFINHLVDERCVYDCLYMDKSICNNYRCEMINSESEEYDISIDCTYEQKNADICTMQYEPVCGSDSRTYGNSCVACQSETVVNYTMGECENSAFVVEGDSKYLQEVEDILVKNGAVTCDLFYTAYDRVVHSFFIADKNRFYSAVDDYSDDLHRNVFYSLAVDGKIYSWSTFPGSEKSVIDYPADIESEIASLLLDFGQYPDFEMSCQGGIDVLNEHLFVIPESD